MKPVGQDGWDDCNETSNETLNQIPGNTPGLSGEVHKMRAQVH